MSNYPPPPPVPNTFLPPPPVPLSTGLSTGENNSGSGIPVESMPPSCTCFIRWDTCAVHNPSGFLRPSPVAQVAAVVGCPPPPPPVPVNPAPSRINVRDKGQRGERQVVAILQEVVNEVRARFGLPAVLIQRNQNQSHAGGHDLSNLGRFSVEVKWQENESVPAWWKQCLEQAGGTFVPILFYRASKQKWNVKFRACVSTPFDTDLVEMDLTTSLEEFKDWFNFAYSEQCDAEARSK